jgi:hypothetical protein
MSVIPPIADIHIESRLTLSKSRLTAEAATQTHYRQLMSQNGNRNRNL